MLYVFGECTLDTQRYELCRAGRVRRLRYKVFQALVYLLAHADRVISKQELREQVWPQQCISDAALESTIKAVRQAIGDSGRGQQLIQTVYGQGYRFLAAVQTHPEAAAGATSEGLLASLSTLLPIPTLARQRRRGRRPPLGKGHDRPQVPPPRGQRARLTALQ